MAPRLLDLFCGPGGAARGYQRAGFYVVGVDISPQPHYIGDEFIQADALTYPLGSFDAIHASPPCQDYSKSLRHLAGGYPRLIGPMRDRLKAAGVPWVIENVAGAPLPVQTDLFGAHGVELCGTMLGLEVIRHRLFETSFPVAAPRGCDHSKPTYNPYNANSRAQRNGGRDRDKLFNAAMGIDWTSGRETTESIPPAYTEYIGRELLKSARLFALGPGGYWNTPRGVPTPIGPVRHPCRLQRRAATARTRRY
jgi:DNA (cytosine-5)-methyltransferase 1